MYDKKVIALARTLFPNQQKLHRYIKNNDFKNVEKIVRNELYQKHLYYQAVTRYNSKSHEAKKIKKEIDKICLFLYKL